MSRSTRVALGGMAVAAVCGLLLAPHLGRTSDDEPWVGSAVSIGQVATALLSYHDATGRLPPAVVRDGAGRPLYSWRVLLLPYLEETGVYQAFRLDEPWDSPHNRPLADATPRCYAPAFFGSRDAPGLTRYQVLVGPGTAFERDGLTWADFPDGPASTLLAVEGGHPVVWSKPGDLAYDPGGPLPPLGAGYTKPAHLLGWTVGRSAGFNGGFGDGRGRFVPFAVGEAATRGLVTRDGGELVDVSRFK